MSKLELLKKLIKAEEEIVKLKDMLSIERQKVESASYAANEIRYLIDEALNAMSDTE